MVNSAAPAQFLTLPGPILDVRSPGEYADGHIPGAESFPLFTNDERAEVGTCYKHQGRDAAVELGLALVGPKMADFVRRAKALAGADKQVRVHCWRGGMRSGSMAWLLQTAGLQVTTLPGGYKAFRRWVRETVAEPRPIIVLGGMTGTAKTDILHALRDRGEPVLDLEGLANHRGSSYGALLLPPQPRTEHFENLIAMQWRQFPTDRPVWIEAESRQVGRCRLPDELMNQMEAAPTLEVTRPVSERCDLLVKIYGEADTESLVAATERVRRRLGGERTQAAVQFIRDGNLRAAVEILLMYYDKAYRYDLERRQKVIPTIDISGFSPEGAAAALLEKVQSWQWHPGGKKFPTVPLSETPGSDIAASQLLASQSLVTGDVTVSEKSASEDKTSADQGSADRTSQETDLTLPVS
ncbi:MAG: tRNA 2-selenouridine(34) synthase MnmH [Cyanobacteria bacterium P01_A01_bin.105]